MMILDSDLLFWMTLYDTTLLAPNNGHGQTAHERCAEVNELS